MKVLFISPAGAAYGSERSMLALLRARQFEAEVVCPGGGALETELRQHKIKVYPLEFGKYSVRQNPFWHLGFYRRFRRILKTSRPDAVVINLDGNTPLVTLAAVWSGIPIIRFSRFEFTPPSRWLDSWCWLKAKAVICPSELVKQQVLAWAPPHFHPRVHRIYDAYAGRVATLEEATAFRQEFGLKNDKLIGCVGRLHRGKRIEVAIRALAVVREQISNARILIIGGDGLPAEAAYKRELLQLATDLGVSESVIFTGFRPAEEMPAAMAALNVCVLPSESESFGMVLMEAWAQGVPTVASDIGGCGEITKISGGGYLAPVGDANTISLHILNMLANTSIAMELGRRGQLWVENSCNLKNYTKYFQSLLTLTKPDTSNENA